MTNTDPVNINDHWVKIDSGRTIPRDRMVLLGHAKYGMWLVIATYVAHNATSQALVAEGHTHFAVLPEWVCEGP